MGAFEHSYDSPFMTKDEKGRVKNYDTLRGKSDAIRAAFATNNIGRIAGALGLNESQATALGDIGVRKLASVITQRADSAAGDPGRIRDLVRETTNRDEAQNALQSGAPKPAIQEAHEIVDKLGKTEKQQNDAFMRLRDKVNKDIIGASNGGDPRTAIQSGLQLLTTAKALDHVRDPGLAMLTPDYMKSLTPDQINALDTSTKIGPYEKLVTEHLFGPKGIMPPFIQQSDMEAVTGQQGTPSTQTVQPQGGPLPQTPGDGPLAGGAHVDQAALAAGQNAFVQGPQGISQTGTLPSRVPQAAPPSPAQPAQAPQAMGPTIPAQPSPVGQALGSAGDMIGKGADLAMGPSEGPSLREFGEALGAGWQALKGGASKAAGAVAGAFEGTPEHAPTTPQAAAPQAPAPDRTQAARALAQQLASQGVPPEAAKQQILQQFPELANM